MHSKQNKIVIAAAVAVSRTCGTTGKCLQSISTIQYAKCLMHQHQEYIPMCRHLRISVSNERWKAPCNICVYVLWTGIEFKNAVAAFPLLLHKFSRMRHLWDIYKYIKEMAYKWFRCAVDRQTMHKCKPWANGIQKRRIYITFDFNFTLARSAICLCSTGE